MPADVYKRQVHGFRGVLVCQLSYKMQSVARPKEFHLVLGQPDLVDLDGAQRIGALWRVPDQLPVFVEAERIVQICLLYTSE